MTNTSVPTSEDILSAIFGDIGVDLAKMLDEMEEEKSNDSDSEADELTDFIGFAKSEAVTVSCAILGVIFIILASLLCDGVLRFIYLIKCVTLMSPFAINCFLYWQIAAKRLVKALEKEVNLTWSMNHSMMNNFSHSHNDDKTENVHVPELINFGLSAFSIFDEILSLVLIHEMHSQLSSLKGKKKNKRMLRWLLRVGIGGIVTIASMGLQTLTIFIRPHSWQMVVLSMTPLHSLISLGITTGILFFGRSMIQTLRESEDFRRKHSSSTGSRSNFLIALILVIGIIQFFKSATRIAVTVSTALEKEVMECAFDFLQLESFLDVLLFLHKCRDLDFFPWDDLLRDPILTAIEFVCVFILLSVKRCRA